ncbi:hypothetical protein BOTBODRAFT_51253 [Botryobasidium botryosum FD-172 SS1]|uniref:Uncharacterized protein n=1 Tax=Botryobasidium botryosum (strain FD-172 SS1) TaxID=930990 RepID=A0A067MWA9_BOTB1|nr:hypothetical protein BOTBODRAFT_51253 [Botryobasidium botryosum FD-172 SS1]
MGRLTGGSALRLFALPLLKAVVINCLTYNVTYDITNSTVTPDFPVTWFLPEVWTEDNNGFNAGGGGRITTTQGATMNFTFVGTAVYLIGVKAPGSDVISITVDNTDPQTRNISSPDANVYWFRQMLFAQEGLNPGTHTFLVNHSSTAGSRLSLDQIIISKDTDIPSGTSGGPPKNTDAPDSAPQPAAQKNKGAIIGGAVAGVVALVAIGVALFLWLRLRKARSAARDTRGAPDVRQTTPAHASPWEPPLNSTVVFTPPPIMRFSSAPGGSHTPSIISPPFGSPEVGPSAMPSPQLGPQSGRVHFVEKPPPTPGPPPYMHQ